MICFVAGIHAVGKSYLCSKYASESECLYRSASELIREYKGSSWGIDKKVTNLVDNQKILIHALSKIKSEGRDLLLDGHFVLIDESEGFTKIDEDVFREMALDRIILIENTPEVIKDRFSARGVHEITFDVTTFSKLEHEHAYHIAETLKIPITLLHAPSYEMFFNAISSE